MTEPTEKSMDGMRKKHLESTDQKLRSVKMGGRFDAEMVKAAKAKGRTPHGYMRDAIMRQVALDRPIV